MSRILHEMKHRDGIFVRSHPLSSPSSLSSLNSFNYEIESTTSSSSGRISPAILLIIVIVAVIFFISGLLHLLFRYFIKGPTSLADHQSNRYTENPDSHSLQGQLQQLFRLHDSGLDQALIDALPIFYYKNIVGLKEPFDCAVCLCEFSEQDKLRLLPTCRHAFHIACIDTWLLSNSTCPLCRGTLYNSDQYSMENPVSSFEVLGEISNGFTSEQENGLSGHHKPEIVQESAAPKRVLSVRLGKFRSTNGEGREKAEGEISCTLDARRCYSMGTYQYVVIDSDLQVALSHHTGCEDGAGSDVKHAKERRDRGPSQADGELVEKKISGRSRAESFSVSKIWLWSKKSRFPCSSSNHDMGELAASLSYYKFANEL